MRELSPAACRVEEALSIREFSQQRAGNAAERVEVVAVGGKSGGEHQHQGKESHDSVVVSEIKVRREK